MPWLTTPFSKGASALRKPTRFQPKTQARFPIAVTIPRYYSEGRLSSARWTERMGMFTGDGFKQ
jgi:hypothetical protein